MIVFDAPTAEMSNPKTIYLIYVNTLLTKHQNANQKE